MNFDWPCNRLLLCHELKNGWTFPNMVRKCPMTSSYFMLCFQPMLPCKSLPPGVTWYFIQVAKDIQEAESQKQVLLSVLHSLGVPLEPAKLEGTNACLEILPGYNHNIAANTCILCGSSFLGIFTAVPMINPCPNVYHYTWHLLYISTIP